MLERVFIVDEDVRIRDLLYEMISEVGYGALTIPTGKELIERLKKERPSLIIIDDTLGEYSGFVLARKVREFDKDIKIIVLGIDPNIDTFSSLVKETGIAAYLKKDFQNPEVIKRIFSVLKEESFLKPFAEKKMGSILIVDDEVESRQTVENFLSRRGFDVDKASSGEECLEKVRQRSFDIILLDITMTGMDGLLTLKRIMDIDRKNKVVMVSALANQHIMAQAKALGAKDYIIKPFNFGTLEASLLSIRLTKA
ncbi:MAG: response regulator [Candidatus Omnitrophota bacterium]